MNARDRRVEAAAAGGMRASGEDRAGRADAIDDHHADLAADSGPIAATEVEPPPAQRLDGERLATALIAEMCRRRPAEFEPAAEHAAWRCARRDVHQDHVPSQLGAFDVSQSLEKLA